MLLDEPSVSEIGNEEEKNHPAAEFTEETQHVDSSSNLQPGSRRSGELRIVLNEQTCDYFNKSLLNVVDEKVEGTCGTDEAG